MADADSTGRDVVLASYAAPDQTGYRVDDAFLDDVVGDLDGAHRFERPALHEFVPGLVFVV